MSRSRNRKNQQNLKISRNLEILAISAISGSGRDFGQNHQNLDFGHLSQDLARFQDLAVRSRIWLSSQDLARQPESDLAARS